jgi:hypothetical protein
MSSASVQIQTSNLSSIDDVVTRVCSKKSAAFCGAVSDASSREFFDGQTS